MVLQEQSLERRHSSLYQFPGLSGAICKGEGIPLDRGVRISVHALLILPPGLLSQHQFTIISCSSLQIVQQWTFGPYLRISCSSPVCNCWLFPPWICNVNMRLMQILVKVTDHHLSLGVDPGHITGTWYPTLTELLSFLPPGILFLSCLCLQLRLVCNKDIELILTGSLGH